MYTDTFTPFAQVGQWDGFNLSDHAVLTCEFRIVDSKLADDHNQEENAGENVEMGT